MNTQTNKKIKEELKKDIERVLKDKSRFGFKIKIVSLWEETKLIDISETKLNKIISIIEND